MIEINLLPAELKKRKHKIEIPKIEFMPIIIIVVAGVLAVQLILSVSLGFKQQSLKRLGNRWGNLKPQEMDAVTTRQQINKLLDKVSNVESIKERRILWAEKLSALSDSMMSGVWLTRLSVDRQGGKRRLVLTGNVSTFGKDETAVVGRFMKALKDNEVFFRNFTEIELGNIQQKQRKDLELMEFVINCYFKG